MAAAPEKKTFKIPITVNSTKHTIEVSADDKVERIIDELRKLTSLPLGNDVLFSKDSPLALVPSKTLSEYGFNEKTELTCRPPKSDFESAMLSKLNEPGGVEYVYQTIEALNTKLRAIDQTNKTEELDLPAIIVVGDQSVGKSSLIVELIGIDILPRREGTCTRTPLEITMRKKNRFDDEKAASFARFEATSAVEVKDIPDDFKDSVKFGAKALPVKSMALTNKLSDLLLIRDEIEYRTNELAGKMGITPYPIVLTLVFPDAPNLRIIDLPGIAQHPKQGQPENIKELTSNLVTYYVKKTKTIVLSIIAANYEFQAQCSWNIVRDGVVKQGKTVVGVLTFMNCIPHGREATWLEVLQSDDPNIEPHLDNGFVAVVTRDKIDVEKFESGDENPRRDAKWGAIKEKEFFSKSEMFVGVHERFLGRESLQKRLIEVQKKFIKQQLPATMDALRKNVLRLKMQVDKWGPIPTNSREYEEVCRTILSNVYLNLSSDFERGKSGANVQKCFEKFRKSMSDIRDPFTDQDVLERKNRGWNIPTGDLDNETFKEMVSSMISDRLETLCSELVESVHATMKSAIELVISQYMTGYDELIKAAREKCLNLYFASSLKESRKAVKNLLEMEKTYVFDPSLVVLTLNADKVKQLNTYFEFIKTTLASSVPKSIMYFYCYPLMHGLRDKLPLVLRNEDKAMADDDFYRRLGSQTGVAAKEREVASKQLAALKEAWDDLRRWQSSN